MRVEGVLAVEDRMRPPGEGPDEDLRIGEEAADDPFLRVRDHAGPEEGKRDEEVEGERTASATPSERATPGEAAAGAQEHGPTVYEAADQAVCTVAASPEAVAFGRCR